MEDNLKHKKNEDDLKKNQKMEDDLKKNQPNWLLHHCKLA